MPELTVMANATVSSALVQALRPIVAHHQTLEQVVRFGLAHPQPKLVGDVVVQDEYTHDVVLPYEEALVLVYDTT